MAESAISPARILVTSQLLGLSGRQLAAALGIDHRGVRRWQAGTQRVSAASAQAIADLVSEHEADVSDAVARVAAGESVEVPREDEGGRPASWWVAVAAHVMVLHPEAEFVFPAASTEQAAASGGVARTVHSVAGGSCPECDADVKELRERGAILTVASGPYARLGDYPRDAVIHDVATEVGGVRNDSTHTLRVDRTLNIGEREERRFWCDCGVAFGRMYDTAARKAYREHRKSA